MAGDVVSIRQKTAYPCFCHRKLTPGIGYRKYVHVNLSGGVGVIMAGKQTTNENSPLLAIPGGGIGADTAGVNTSYNIPQSSHGQASVGAGVSERIPYTQVFQYYAVAGVYLSAK